MAERRADLHALRAALAVDRVDEDAEAGRCLALACRHLGVLGGVREVRTGRSRPPAPAARCRGKGLDADLEVSLGDGDAQDGGVGAGIDAGHAADALLEQELGDARREAGEVAHRGRAGRDEAARHAGLGRQLAVGDAAAVGRDDRRRELLDVAVHIQHRLHVRGEADLVMLLGLAGRLGQRAATLSRRRCGHQADGRRAVIVGVVGGS